MESSFTPTPIKAWEMSFTVLWSSPSDFSVPFRREALESALSLSLLLEGLVYICENYDWAYSLN